MKVLKVKINHEDDFVSMIAFDMLANAYNDLFDECVRLRAKLDRIKEVIKE